MAKYLVDGDTYEFKAGEVADIEDLQAPFVFTATLTTTAQGDIDSITNPSATTEQVAEAVGDMRPVYLLAYGTQGSYYRYIFAPLDEAMITNTASTKSFYFTVFDGTTKYSFRYRDNTIQKLNTWKLANTDITSGSFIANTGVSASAEFSKQNNVYTINFSATGTFSSGTTTLGTFGGLGMAFNANGIIGTCAISTGGGNYDAIGTYILAEDGELSITYSGTYKKVCLNLSYIL